VRVAAIALERNAIRRDPWYRRSAGRDEGDLVGEADRPFGDDVELVADVHVFPIAR
jgi:hypothetical protein